MTPVWRELAASARRLVEGLGLLTLTATPVAAQTPAVIVEYYHVDALGSVRAVTDASGAVVTRHDFAPFGEEIPPQIVGVHRLQFTGKERDASTGLDYFGARFYASRTGRFTSVDPAFDLATALVNPQSWSRYSYALNNPVRYIDPNGKQAAEAALNRDIRALMAHQITVEEYNARVNARGVGATAGLLSLAGPIAWRMAVGCMLSPSCQSAIVEALDGGTGRVGSARAVSSDELGKAREAYVARLVGGRLANDVRVSLQGVGTSAIDVYGKAGEFIGVGGPSKAFKLSVFGTHLKVLAAAAEEAGVKAQYYLEVGTPLEAFRLAQKWLGKDNVHWFALPK